MYTKFTQHLYVGQGVEPLFEGPNSAIFGNSSTRWLCDGNTLFGYIETCFAAAVITLILYCNGTPNKAVGQHLKDSAVSYQMPVAVSPTTFHANKPAGGLCTAQRVFPPGHKGRH